jgi:NAD(P)H-flavin reductase
MAALEKGRVQSLSCELLQNSPVIRHIHKLTFLWRGDTPRAGQFCLIKPRHSSLLLGRPFSVFSVLRRNSSEAEISFLAANRGKGSNILCSMQPGEWAEITGPLGNCWADAAAQVSVDQVSAAEAVHEAGAGAPDPEQAAGTKQAAGAAKPFGLISGGVGVAALASWALETSSRPVDFFAGFRSAPFGLEGVESRLAENGGRLVVVTEDGSAGRRGFVTDAVDLARYAAVFACGPHGLLARIACACAAAAVPCFVSMENRMACGLGVCRGCVIHTTGGNKSCCADGPIFNAAEVVSLCEMQGARHDI